MRQQLVVLGHGDNPQTFVGIQGQEKKTFMHHTDVCGWLHQ